jgi:CRP-like cAMP-binding protein
MISTVEKVLFLKGIELFSQIPGEDLSQIALITDEVEYDEGESIFEEGDPGDSLYFVIEGKVRVHSGGVQLAVAGERQVFGEMAVLDGELRSASISALSDLTLLRIHRDDFKEILREKPEIAQGIIQVLTRRLRGMLAGQKSVNGEG